MHKAFIIVLTAAALFTGCQQSSTPSPAAASPKPAPAAAPRDAVDQKLQEIAGAGASNCGRMTFKDDVSTASNCAMQANQAKRPFYVAYEMPGLVVGIAGAPDGKLYTIEWQPPHPGKAGTDSAAQLTANPCSTPLRVAQSGRVTCMAPFSMGQSDNPHGAMMPGGSGHDGLITMPPGMPNPHGSMPTKPGVENPHREGQTLR